MAEFEDPAFEDDPYDAHAPDDDVVLPDAGTDPPLDVQQGLLAAGDDIQRQRGELKREGLVAQKKRLVDTFYKEVSRAEGLRPEGSVDYDQFGIDDDGKTLYWTPGDKKIPITTTRGGFRFLALSTLASRYGSGGVNAIRQSLGLTDYKSSMPRLGKKATKTLQKAEETLPKNIEAVEMTELPGVANGAILTTKDVETALKTIDDQPIDTAWVTPAVRELAGLEKAMTRNRDELVNNLAKLSEVDSRKTEAKKRLAQEQQKLAETNDPELQQEIQDRIRKLQSDLSDIELERQARLEAASTNREALRSQISRIRETFRRMLHEDKTLGERIRTLFREQGITIASILTAIGMAI